MKPILLALALLLPAAPAVLAAGPEVAFSLTLGHNLAPSHKTCTIAIAPGANGGDVLDAATRQGCISGWEFDRFGGSRFVTCIDGLCQQPGTFWAFYVDEALPDGGSSGIDDVHVHGGERVEFAYRDWFTPFPPFGL